MSGRGSNAAPSRELLLAHHSFPGEYIVKAFGPGLTAFHDEVLACAVEVVGANRVHATARTSRHGRRVCVTLHIAADTVDEVIQIYDAVHQVPDLMLIL